MKIMCQVSCQVISMEIKEMSNNELFRRYAELRIEIDTNYSTKKQMEKEMQDRLRDGRLGE